MKKEKGYFTVEAALVFPLVLGAVLFAVYWLIFQYDRCLLEQDTGLLAVWGSCEQESDREQLTRKIEEKARGLYLEKYAAWKMTKLDVMVEKGSFSVSGGGELTFPVPEVNFFSEKNVWEAEKSFRFYRIDAEGLVRLCRRLWMETEKQEEGGT